MMKTTIPGYCLYILICFTFSSFNNSNGTQIPKEKKKLQLNDKRELFVDSYLIESMTNTSLVLHRPVDKGPVLYFDKPWEGALCGYVTVIKDSYNYKIYYRGIAVAGADGTNAERTCIATSEDGINWIKPELGIHQVEGSKNNNVVIANMEGVTHNFSPLMDFRPGVDPKERYKALGGGTKTGGLFALKSEDGVHWEKMQEKPVLTDGVFDSQNVAFWSESEQCYVSYFRTWTEGTKKNKYKGYRSISRATSNDFINWSKSVPMDFGKAPMEHLYTNQTTPYFRAPHIYIALAARYMKNRTVVTEEEAKKLKLTPLKFYKDCSDAVFMTSRGGNSYDRSFLQGFIVPGIGANNWTSRTNYPALHVLQTGIHEMSVYVNQDYGQPSAHVRRYALRLDGFSSLRGTYEGGEMVTRPFTFTGNRLEINYASSAAGEIKIEIQDAEGEPIKNYTLEDSETIIGNEIERIVSWNNESDIQKLSEKTIRLRIYLKDADLYSIRFKN